MAPRVADLTLLSSALYASPIHGNEGDDMMKNACSPVTYREIADHFGLKARQRTALDTMDALAFAEAVAAFEDGDHAEAGKILVEYGVMRVDECGEVTPVVGLEPTTITLMSQDPEMDRFRQPCCGGHFRHHTSRCRQV